MVSQSLITFTLEYNPIDHSAIMKGGQLALTVEEQY